MTVILETGVPPLKVEDRLIMDAKAKAEALHKHFDKAFSNGRTNTAQEFRHNDRYQRKVHPHKEDHCDHRRSREVAVKSESYESLRSR